MTAERHVSALLDQTTWQVERRKLRSLLLESGLKEGVNLGMLCYSLGQANVAIIYGMRDCCAIGFFKGALLEDGEPLLVSPGKNSQTMRQLRFRSLDEIQEQEATIRSLIARAVAVERAGQEVSFDARHNLDLPYELQIAFEEDPEFGAAFDRLTPGRQRGYVLYFAEGRQSETRASRIAGARPKILIGKGRHDR
jgi:uncharacterized protein YdeI (YjbR/CyaY-like superfamily)